MTLAFIAVVSGFALLVWSADWFVEGSAFTARHFRIPSLLIGMVIVGFGTSLPEMVISGLAAYRGSPGLALGNAYGSNICNIALILGVAALIRPIAFQSQVLRKELPILAVVTALAAWQLWDKEISRYDATVLLAVFTGLVAWTVWQRKLNKDDTLRSQVRQKLDMQAMSIRQAVSRLVVGLVFLVVSSRILVWGAVEIAHGLGISDLVVGLTVLALGTSLPELASSIAAVSKQEHDIALGNILGSNLFNTLVVVGTSGLIRPLAVAPEVLNRDVPVMAALTLSLFIIGYRLRTPGRINRIEGGVLLVCYAGYIAYLVRTVL
jgi:cation:H+ antiporter